MCDSPLRHEIAMQLREACNLFLSLLFRGHSSSSLVFYTVSPPYYPVIGTIWMKGN